LNIVAGAAPKEELEVTMWQRSARTVGAFATIVLVLAFMSCGKSSPTAPTPGPCTFSLSTTALSFDAPGGNGVVTVTTARHCTWTAASDRGWMTIDSGANGTGNGTVTVNLTANAGTEERTGTLTVAGRAVPVRQEGRTSQCTIQLSPASVSFSRDSATSSFLVVAAEQCRWSAVSDSAWLAVTSGSPGTGRGSVAYSVERNRASGARKAIVTVGDARFTVTQAGDSPAPVCTYSVTPVVFSPCMSVPADLTATVSTQQGCTWTADSDSAWISIGAGRSGNGPGVITFRVSDNWDAPRAGVVRVRWPTVTAGQNLHVSQAGCRYAVSASAIDIPAAGGPGRFDVIQQSNPLTCGGPLQNGCIWSAMSNVSWIRITTAMPQAGDNPVTFTVAPNATGTARTGTVTVRDQVVRITQAGS
jgi:hypothetical protein